MDTFTSHSPAETMAFAQHLAARLRPGTVLGLVGDLGGGKTQFVKGLALGLGVTEPVLSPTFALLHLHSSGRVPLYHIDLYRLQSDEQIFGAGLDEYFTPDGIAVFEWWDRWQGRPPASLLRFTFETLSQTERRITYDDPGS